MPETASGALVIWHDVTPGAEALVNDWYNREHHLERVGLPGFLSARRYEALSGEPKLFNLYRVRDLSALTSPEYLDRLNHPTEWSRRAIPNCRNMSRTACRFLLQSGTGEGGTAGTWRLSAEPEREDALAAWLREQALPGIAAARGVVSVALLKGDPGASAISSRERKLRGDQDRWVDLVVVVTANNPEIVKQIRTAALSESSLRAQGARASSAFGIYRLVFAL